MDKSEPPGGGVPADGGRLAWTVVAIVVGLLVVAIVIDDQEPPQNQPSASSSETSATAPSTPKIDSHVYIYHWENDFYDDVVAVVTNYNEGTADEEGSKSWTMRGESDARGGWFEKVPCSPPQTYLTILVGDVQGNVLDYWESKAFPCSGDGASYKIRVTGSGTVRVLDS